MVSGKDQLKPSYNPWDWLGPGVYFWEENPYKALQYAEKCANKSQKFSGEIHTPLVIGAIIELRNCLNLVEPNSINIVKEAFSNLKRSMEQAGETMPENKKANRERDCAVIKYVHESNKRTGLDPYDTIRSPFHEGKEIYDQANFTAGLHMEICVINTECIKGYFLPQPLEQFNPYLNKEFSPTQK